MSRMGAKAIGVVSINSCSYIDTIFKCLDNDKVIVPLRAVDDDERIVAAGVDEVIVPSKGGGWFKGKHIFKNCNADAIISFTSGTEGKAKAVLLSHSNLADVVGRLNSVMALTKEVREYVGVPVYHSFGFGRCRAVSAVGGQVFIPERGFNPQEIALMLKNDEINSISTVPSLWRILLASKHLFGTETAKLKWIEIGSQYMSASEKLGLRVLFPKAVIVQHYGLTEASRTTLLEIHKEAEEDLESVGRPLNGVEIKINDIGCIAIRGDHVAARLINKGNQSRLSDGEGWFETNDLGEIKNGLLFFKGRADDIINCSGIKLSPEAIESSVFDKMGAITNFAITRIPDPLRGDGILVAVTPEFSFDRDVLLEHVKSTIEEMGIKAANAVIIREVDTIPTTGVGKVQRKKLSETFLKNMRVNGDALNGATRKKGLRFRISEIIGAENINGNDTFSGLGGDSLAYISISMILESLIPNLPANWENIPIDNLEALITKKGTNIADNIELDFNKQNTPELPQGNKNCNPDGIGFWKLVSEDFRTNNAELFSQGFFALFVNRFGNWRMSLRWKLVRVPMTLLYLFLRKLVQIICGIKLDYTVEVGRRVKLEHFGGMILGARRIGNDVIIRQNTTLGITSIYDLKAKPIIENNVDIGAGAVITGSITIGKGSVIGANSVVFTNIPPYSLVMGNPGKVVSQLKKRHN